MNFRNYLVGTIFFILLIWGPIDHSWPVWLGIRIGYLLLVPLAIWFLLGLAWKYWRPSNKFDTILERILSGMISIVLFLLAIFKANSKTHLDNTQWIQTRDGSEAVGHEVVLRSTDWVSVFLLVIIAVLFFWFGVLKKNIKSSHRNN